LPKASPQLSFRFVRWRSTTYSTPETPSSRSITISPARPIGDPTTGRGFSRVADPNHPQIEASYANRFADGRKLKSISIGIKDSTGIYIASVCLNVDLSFSDAF